MKKGVLYTFGASIILIICFVAFVLPSSLSRTAGQQEGLVFGKYDGKKISYEYGSDFTNFLSQYAEMYRNNGMEINSSNQFTIYSYAFNSTVVKYAQEEVLKAAGYEVPQDSINRKVKVYFTDADGKFSKKAYMQADSSYIDNLTKSIKESLYTGRYFDDNFGTTESFCGYKLFGLKAADAETEFLDTFAKEFRSFKMATFSTNNYPEEEQVKFGKANSDKFIKYDMSVITVKTKEIANKVTSRIAKGQITFEDAVAEYSDKNYSDSNGKLSNNSQYQIENILNDKDSLIKVTGLAAGEVSPALETTIGFSIFKNNAAPVSPDFTSEETIKDVKNYITIYEKTIIEDYYTDIANKFIKEAKQTSFDEAAANYADVTVSDVPASPLNYGAVKFFDTMDTESNTALASADRNEDFLKNAFSIKLGEYSNPIVLNGDIAVLQYIAEGKEEPAEGTEEAVEEEKESNYSLLIADVDENASQAVIFASPKLENNFIGVYFDNFMSSSY